MTAVTISTNQGVDYAKSGNYTVATTAPTTNFDFEVRYQLLNQATPQAAVTKMDLIRFLQAVIYGLESNVTGTQTSFFASAVNGTNFTGPQI